MQPTTTFMRYAVLIFFLFLLPCCETNSFDKDKRQISAKNAIRNSLPPASHQFEITGFKEDTLTDRNDSAFQQTIRYTLQFLYKDSAGVMQQKTGYVFFTPDGKSIIKTLITGTH